MSEPKDARKGPIEPRSIPPDRNPAADQPRWRKDFPIDWLGDDYVSRRDLIKYIVLTSGALAVGQAVVVSKQVLEATEAPEEALAIATLDELPVGEAKTFYYPEGSTPRLLIRIDESTFVAYDQQCTHLLCPVVPKVEQNKIHCPCHNGWFDLKSGVPIAGPPRRRLPRILLELRADTVYATGIRDSLS